jgi:hypothetical protein
MPQDPEDASWHRRLGGIQDRFEATISQTQLLADRVGADRMPLKRILAIRKLTQDLLSITAKRNRSHHDPR